MKTKTIGLKLFKIKQKYENRIKMKKKILGSNESVQQGFLH